MMVIENLYHRYLVIEQLSQTMITSQYLCHRIKPHEDTPYTISCMKRKYVSGELVKFLSQCDKDKHFTDFEEFFTNDQYLFIVLKAPLPAWKAMTELSQKQSFSWRLEAGRKLLEKLLIYQLPVYFLARALNPAGIFFSDSMDIGFRYDISDINTFHNVEMTSVQNSMYELYSLLFAEELGLKSLPEMELWLDHLKHCSTLMEMYQGYMKNYEQWIAQPESALIPRTAMFKFYDAVQKLAGVLVKIGYVLIIFLALFYSIFSIYQYCQPKPRIQHFDMIGQMEIGGTADE